MNVVIYTPSRSVKGRIVIDYLYNNNFFTKNYSVSIITDVENIDFTEKFGSKFDIHVDDGKIPKNFTNVDFIVTLGWGGILKNDIISKANCAALNCHSSMLPDYKGGSVYHHYWANCEDFSGATIHYLTDKLDSGNIIAQSQFKLNFNDTPNSILQRASELTGPLLVEALLKIQLGYQGEPNNGGRYFLKIKSTYQVIFYRILNCCLKKIGLPKKLMPYKFFK
jgi:hypothetical protein